MIGRKGAAALAVATALLLASEASAQGILDLFGADGPSRRAAPRPSRDIPRAAEKEKKRAEPRTKKREARKSDKAAEPAKPATGAEAPPPPYEAQMTRLTEVLGALSFLRDLCGAGDGDDWRGKMSALLDAEAPNGPRRDKFIASFNRGFRGYELAYRVCTPNAKTAISRYLDEASRLSLDITYRYGSP
ncbi:TIGR02301 family protein [Methylocystis sp. WRRC1]|uniref:TIGR02301 family protein n=1 Tax=Methylocystis sp. WRRC1 TaxID=1732014 RepID=UPI001D13C109|nr:TIGR02301 family protein [Methylocystis sp. WRRC1]MCC3245653.1 TIGR02301 family protein [Methylocystis sp. WRRC1]